MPLLNEVNETSDEYTEARLKNCWVISSRPKMMYLNPLFYEILEEVFLAINRVTMVSKMN